MPYYKYEEYNPQQATERLLSRCQSILDEYEDEGMVLTVRQLFYQLVSRDVIENQQSQYDRLQRIVKRGRRAGYLDWEMIVDRGRNLRKRQRWDDPKQIIEASAQRFHLDLWQDQRCRPEVWIEKDALVGVIKPTCKRWDVPYLSTRGYVSDSAAWRAAQRFRDVMDGEQSDRPRPALPENEVEQIPVVIHLSDHDPSGVDMTRDLEEKFEMFGLHFPVQRVALTMEQIREYDPPPNYAKASDSRSDGYVSTYGTECWELDALDPTVIRSVVDRAIQDQLSDRSAFDERKHERQNQRDRLEEVSERWTEFFE